MSAGWAIFWFVVIMFFLVFIHELGHFTTAKWRKVKVLEFGMGLPPRIWGKQRGETMYSINWIPFGGFCKMLGEEDPTAPRSLAAQGPGTRLLVLSAGSLVMLIFPVILYGIVSVVPHKEVTGARYEITGVVEDTPAAQAGLLAGDQLLKIDDMVVDSSDVLDITHVKAGSEISVTVLRGSEEISVVLVPRKEGEYPSDQGPMGVTLKGALIEERVSHPVWQAPYWGLNQSWRVLTAIGDFIADAITHKVEFKLTGAVGAGQATTELASEFGAWSLVDIAAMLSINFAIVNLLPLPALDGGRIVFVLIEMVRRGKRVSPQTEARIHLVGFALLIALMFALVYWDVGRILRG
ncbi:MAG: site-2 protease family protein, partial [Chloroflexi bacterium]|nr:site-2 protease family protein [Chloroflexota bacterium]